MRRLMLAGAASAVFAAASVAATAWAGSPPPINNQPFVYLSIDDRSATEGESATMTIRTWPTAPTPIYVSWRTEDHTATAGLDYPTQSGGAVIAAGRPSTTIDVATSQDATHELDEHFHVYIASSQIFVKYTKPKADLTILNDDPVPTVAISGADPVTEGGDLVFGLSLSHPTVDTVTVTMEPNAPGTSPGWTADDYVGQLPTQVVFAPLQTHAYYTVHTVDDTLHEQTETTAVGMRDATNAQLGTPTDVTGSVLDNDVESLCTAGSEDFSAYTSGDKPTTFGGAAGGTIDTGYGPWGRVYIQGTDWGGFFPMGTHLLFPGESVYTFRLTFTHAVGSVALEAHANDSVTDSVSDTLTAYDAADNVIDQDIAPGHPLAHMSVASAADDIKYFTVGTNDADGVGFANVAWGCN